MADPIGFRRTRRTQAESAADPPESAEKNVLADPQRIRGGQSLPVLFPKMELRIEICFNRVKNRIDVPLSV